MSAERAIKDAEAKAQAANEKALKARAEYKVCARQHSPPEPCHHSSSLRRLHVFFWFLACVWGFAAMTRTPGGLKPNMCERPRSVRNRRHLAQTLDLRCHMELAA